MRTIGVAVASGLTLALWAMAWLPGASATPFPLLALWAVAFGTYAVAAAHAHTFSPRVIWGGALLMRLGLVPASPTLSEDVYRYLWDGWMQVNGVNPFAHAPSASELAPLRLDWWPLINHPDVPTIYPPGAQVAFLVLVAMGPGWLLLKLAWIATDFLVARFLAGLIEKAPRRRTVLILYLWSPLLIVEVAWSGHLEPLGLVAMLGAVAMARRRRGAAAGALVGLGASIKFAPLAAVPTLWRRYGVRAAALAVAVPALLYVPYAGVGLDVFEGLRTYLDVWAFNAGAFRALEALPGPADVPRLAGAMGVAGVAGWAAWRRRSLARALYWTIGAAILLSPTIHPWYLLWVLPFACLYGGRGWILYTGTVFLAYAGRDAYLAGGTWPEPGWLTALIHVPPIALLAWDAVRDTGPKPFGGGGERENAGAERLERRREVAAREEPGER